MNGFFIAVLALIGLLVVANCWLGWQLLRQNGRILLRLDELEKRLDALEFGESDEPAGLPVGSAAPDFMLPDLAGDQKSLAQFHGQPLLLIFFNPACGFCRDLAPKLAALFGVRRQAERDAALDNPAGTVAPIPSAVTAGAVQNDSDRSSNRVPLLLIISAGDAETNRQFFSEHKVHCPVLLQKESEVAAAYRARGTPTGYFISREGKIASELAVGAEALLALANRGVHAPSRAVVGTSPNTLSDEAKGSSHEKNHVAVPAGEGADRDERGARAPHSDTLPTDGRVTRLGNRSLARSKLKRDGLKAGTSAPNFRLPRVDGDGDVSLEALRGRRVLLVFSDPHCGPCNVLAPQLEQFHREHTELALVMISRGEPKENRAKVKEHALTFPVLLQAHWEISRRYAMFATPIAYLIDEAGIITNDVAVGMESILNLTATAGTLVGDPAEA